VGATIRYIVTGVPPEQDIDDYIQWKNRPVKKAIQAFKRTKSTKRYRSSDSIPGDVMDLIRDLTHYDSNKRASVRSATRHPWISEAQPDCADGDLTFMDHGGPIEYLKCAKAIP
jgi:serine/threonine protein kinase